MDHFMKQNEKAKDGHSYEAKRNSKDNICHTLRVGCRSNTERQSMEQFMHQCEKAKDG
jgi:hypothetical protein